MTDILVEPTAACCDRTEALLQSIRPGASSLERRSLITQYMQSVVSNCFSDSSAPVHLVQFGSVPLMTFLPDGDIDLSIMSADSSLKEAWATRLFSWLEEEQTKPDTQFRITNVQIINAEVKLLKCLVDNIVVDISYHQVGGITALRFLEEVDKLIPGHIFKKSVILVKAWCYYESRVLGAHHGLFSTYALEVLVLHVFNRHHRKIKSPIQVLYLFLMECSRFDWDRFCLCLKGRIPLTSFPDYTIENLVSDDALLSPDVEAECVRKAREHEGLAEMGVNATPPTPSTTPPIESAAAAAAAAADSNGTSATPPAQPAPAPPPPRATPTFVVRCLNIQDPLMPTNNVGRSVTRGNMHRVRKAFAHGAMMLAKLVVKDGDEAHAEFDEFFRNVWNAQRPMRHYRPLLGPGGRSPPGAQQQQQGQQQQHQGQQINANSARSSQEPGQDGQQGQQAPQQQQQQAQPLLAPQQQQQQQQRHQNPQDITALYNSMAQVMSQAMGGNAGGRGGRGASANGIPGSITRTSAEPYMQPPPQGQGAANAQGPQQAQRGSRPGGLASVSLPNTPLGGKQGPGGAVLDESTLSVLHSTAHMAAIQAVMVPEGAAPAGAEDGTAAGTGAAPNTMSYSQQTLYMAAMNHQMQLAAQAAAMTGGPGGTGAVPPDSLIAFTAAKAAQGYHVTRMPDPAADWARASTSSHMLSTSPPAETPSRPTLGAVPATNTPTTAQADGLQASSSATDVSAEPGAVLTPRPQVSDATKSAQSPISAAAAAAAYASSLQQQQQQAAAVAAVAASTAMSPGSSPSMPVPPAATGNTVEPNPQQQAMLMQQFRMMQMLHQHQLASAQQQQNISHPQPLLPPAQQAPVPVEADGAVASHILLPAQVSAVSPARPATSDSTHTPQSAAPAPRSSTTLPAPVPHATAHQPGRSATQQPQQTQPQQQALPGQPLQQGMPMLPMLDPQAGFPNMPALPPWLSQMSPSQVQLMMNHLNQQHPDFTAMTASGDVLGAWRPAPMHARRTSNHSSQPEQSGEVWPGGQLEGVQSGDAPWFQLIPVPMVPGGSAGQGTPGVPVSRSISGAGAPVAVAVPTPVVIGSAPAGGVPQVQSGATISMGRNSLASQGAAANAASVAILDRNSAMGLQQPMMHMQHMQQAGLSGHPHSMQPSPPSWMFTMSQTRQQQQQQQQAGSRGGGAWQQGVGGQSQQQAARNHHRNSGGMQQAMLGSSPGAGMHYVVSGSAPDVSGLEMGKWTQQQQHGGDGSGHVAVHSRKERQHISGHQMQQLQMSRGNEQSGSAELLWQPSVESWPDEISNGGGTTPGEGPSSAAAAAAAEGGFSRSSSAAGASKQQQQQQQHLPLTTASSGGQQAPASFLAPPAHLMHHPNAMQGFQALSHMFQPGMPHLAPSQGNNSGNGSGAGGSGSSQPQQLPGMPNAIMMGPPVMGTMAGTMMYPMTIDPSQPANTIMGMASGYNPAMGMPLHLGLPFMMTPMSVPPGQGMSHMAHMLQGMTVSGQPNNGPTAGNSGTNSGPALNQASQQQHAQAQQLQQTQGQQQAQQQQMMMPPDLLQAFQNTRGPFTLMPPMPPLPGVAGMPPLPMMGMRGATPNMYLQNTGVSSGRPGSFGGEGDTSGNGSGGGARHSNASGGDTTGMIPQGEGQAQPHRHVQYGGHHGQNQGGQQQGQGQAHGESGRQSGTGRGHGRSGSFGVGTSSRPPGPYAIQVTQEQNQSANVGARQAARSLTDELLLAHNKRLLEGEGVGVDEPGRGYGDDAQAVSSSPPSVAAGDEEPGIRRRNSVTSGTGIAAGGVGYEQQHRNSRSNSRRPSAAQQSGMGMANGPGSVGAAGAASSGTGAGLARRRSVGVGSSTDGGLDEERSGSGRRRLAPSYSAAVQQEVAEGAPAVVDGGGLRQIQSFNGVQDTGSLPGLPVAAVQQSDSAVLPPKGDGVDSVADSMSTGRPAADSHKDGPALSQRPSGGSARGSGRLRSSGVSGEQEAPSAAVLMVRAALQGVGVSQRGGSIERSLSATSSLNGATERAAAGRAAAAAGAVGTGSITPRPSREVATVQQGSRSRGESPHRGLDNAGAPPRVPVGSRRHMSATAAAVAAGEDAAVAQAPAGVPTGQSGAPTLAAILVRSSSPAAGDTTTATGHRLSKGASVTGAPTRLSASQRSITTASGSERSSASGEGPAVTGSGSSGVWRGSITASGGAKPLEEVASVVPSTRPTRTLRTIGTDGVGGRTTAPMSANVGQPWALAQMIKSLGAAAMEGPPGTRAAGATITSRPHSAASITDVNWSSTAAAVQAPASLPAGAITPWVQGHVTAQLIMSEAGLTSRSSAARASAGPTSTGHGSGGGTAGSGTGTLRRSSATLLSGGGASGASAAGTAVGAGTAAAQRLMSGIGARGVGVVGASVARTSTFGEDGSGQPSTAGMQPKSGELLGGVLHRHSGEVGEGGRRVSSTSIGGTQGQGQNFKLADEDFPDLSESRS